MARKYHQGKYIVKNRHKYVGDADNVIYRSSWEKKLFIWLDLNESVISWSSEEAIVPYISPLDGKVHRYFVDAHMEIIDVYGNRKLYLLEVKPKTQTIEPKKQDKITKGYIQNVTTWAVNQAKWKAAEEFCKSRGWEFKLITEDILYPKKKRNLNG